MSMSKLQPVIDRLVGHETEIRLREGEVLQGMPMEVSLSHITFEEAHGDYRCLDFDEIESIQAAA